jgi:hypothetical protein
MNNINMLQRTPRAPLASSKDGVYIARTNQYACGAAEL